VKCTYRFGCEIPLWLSILEAVSRNMAMPWEAIEYSPQLAKEYPKYTGEDLQALLYSAQLELVYGALPSPDNISSAAGNPAGYSVETLKRSVDNAHPFRTKSARAITKSMPSTRALRVQISVVTLRVASEVELRLRRASWPDSCAHVASC
jgi:hypothetical protein